MLCKSDSVNRLRAIHENERTPEFSHLFREIRCEFARLKKLYGTTHTGRANTIVKGKRPAPYGATNLENLQELRRYISTQIPNSYDVVSHLIEARGSGRTGLQAFIVVIPRKIPQASDILKDFLEL